MTKNKKIVKYKRPFRLNIGVIVFLVIFVYLSYFVYQYFTTEHVSVFEVVKGKIAQNRDYTGLILRDETVYQAEKSGKINYFVQDGTKAGSHSYVYTIDETGEFYNEISTAMNGISQLDQKYLDKLGSTAYQFTSNYSDQAFYQVYDFGFDLQADLKEGLTQAAVNGGDDNLEESLSNSNVLISRAEQSGIVVYHVDGLEQITQDQVTKKMFDPGQSKRNNLLGRKEVKKGDPVYKMINSEHWSILLPIEPELKQQLAEKKELRIRFKEDDSTAVAAVSLLQKGSSDYLVLSLEHSVIRFAGQRYVEIELMLEENSGLKIPNTAILEKEFFVIPQEYLIKGGNSNQNGVIKATPTEDGDWVEEFIAVEPFFESEEGYYIAQESLKQGDQILLANSNERLPLTTTDKLPGVYNINRGYASFRRIEMIAQNEEYTIVKEKTEYGLSFYDHIALDGSLLKENELIK